MWRRAAVITPIESSSWRFVWWSKMACPTALPAGTCGAITACLCPLPPSKIGLRLGEKKAQRQMDSAFLEWALDAFSGYVAVDELYEGPYCVLSAVDNCQYKRIRYEVLDHDPDHDDIKAFLERLKTALDDRELTLKGITTDGSALYPEPIRKVLGEVPSNSRSVLKSLCDLCRKPLAEPFDDLFLAFVTTVRRASMSDSVPSPFLPALT